MAAVADPLDLKGGEAMKTIFDDLPGRPGTDFVACSHKLVQNQEKDMEKYKRAAISYEALLNGIIDQEKEVLQKMEKETDDDRYNVLLGEFTALVRHYVFVTCLYDVRENDADTGTCRRRTLPPMSFN